MAKDRSLPKYMDDLAGFAGILRKRVFSSQGKAADYFHLNRSTVVRYESDKLTPPLGYLACLARLLIERLKLEDEGEITDCQQMLLRQLNKAVRYDYGDVPIQNWDELSSIADDYLTQQRARTKTKNAQNATFGSLDIGFFIGAVKTWFEDFFRWSEAGPHPRSSWAGMVLYGLSAIAARITPRGTLIFLGAVGLWIVTGWLLTPILQWPPGDAHTRWVASLKYAAATLSVPLLVASATRPDVYQNFPLDGLRQRATLWLLKFTGALVGFYTFSMLAIGLALIGYYLNRPPLAIETRSILAVIPLFFCYVTARRIPADRIQMFQGNLQLHRADPLFLGVFVFAGPVTASFLYTFNWFLVDRTLGPVGLLIALIVIALWEYKKPDSA
ncbi:MAG: hypothetical protein ACE5H9_10720 [Anaerolineae bacterium]